MPDLIDEIPAGYLSFTDNGTIVKVNETLCRLTGFQLEELIGRHVETLFTVATKIFFQTHLFPLVKMQGHAEEIFITLQGKMLQLPVLININRTGGENPLNICIIILVENRNKFEGELIAAKKTAEKALIENSELQEAKEKLKTSFEEAERHLQDVIEYNKELAQFNHAVTHSLKEPIRKILMFSDKLKERYFKDSEDNDFLRLLTSIKQMNTTVTGLQQYIWLNEATTRFSKINLQKIIESVEKEIEKSNPGILEIDISECPKFYADGAQMQLLFFHILCNAVKFRKGDSAKVHILTTILKRNTFKLLKDKYDYRDYLKIEITDHGTGFDPAFREDIFGLFKRMHNIAGYGLGLALCRRIVKNHRGEIFADSVPGDFTKITVVIPFLENEAPEEP